MSKVYVAVDLKWNEVWCERTLDFLVDYMLEPETDWSESIEIVCVGSGKSEVVDLEFCKKLYDAALKLPRDEMPSWVHDFLDRFNMPLPSPEPSDRSEHGTLNHAQQGI